MRFDGDSLEMETLFGEEKVIKGTVLEIDFSASKIIIEQHRASGKEDDSSRDDRA